MENQEYQFYIDDLFADQNWLALTEQFKEKKIGADDYLLGNDYTVFGRVFSEYYDFCIEKTESSDLTYLFNAMLAEATNFKFHIVDNMSFWGALFHTSYSQNELLQLISRDEISPLNSDGDIYLGSIKPIIAHETPIELKNWGLTYLLDSKWREDIQGSLGRALVDLFIGDQWQCLWAWHDEFKSERFYIYEAKEFKQDVELLLSLGANINDRSNYGQTVAMRASMQWMPEALEFLISKGADVNLQQDQGNTALMYVSGYLPDTSPMDEEWIELPEHLAIAKILVGAGADIDIENDRGEKAIDLAYKNKNTAVLNYLQSLQRP